MTILAALTAAVAGAFADGGTPRPVPASLHQILVASPQSWQDPDFGLYRWDRFPRVLVFDMASGSLQDRMFTRLAYFLEKKGYAGRMMTDAELRGMRGWNAHDYGPDGLAAFFDRARAEGVALNDEELLLRSITVDDGQIVARGGGFGPGEGGVLSISRSSGAALRRLFLTHEAFHGLFFASPAYRLACLDLWNSLTPDQQVFQHALLAALGYDTSDLTLVVNETQAYLLQQPLEITPAYLERVAGLVAPADLPVGGVRALIPLAEKLDRITRQRFGIEAGATSLITGDHAP